MTTSAKDTRRHSDARAAVCPACWPRVHCGAVGRKQTVLDTIEISQPAWPASSAVPVLATGQVS